MTTNTREGREPSQRGFVERRKTNHHTVTIDTPFFHNGYGKLLLMAVIAKLLGVNVAEVGALVIKSSSPHLLDLTSSLLAVIMGNSVIVTLIPIAGDILRTITGVNGL